MSKTHVIDGVTYVEVDRQAEVGDKVLITNVWDSSGKYGNGSVLEVIYGGIVSDTARTDYDENNPEGFVSRREYVVIEPVETVDQTQASQEVLDLLANLARRLTAAEGRVTALESQLRDTQRNVETWAEETERNVKDIATLDSRTYSLTTVQSAEGILNEIARLVSRRSDRQ